jgi:hypothetical protein
LRTQRWPRQSVFPFFVGRGRSGTTLFRAIFDSHSHLAIPGESHLPELFRRRRWYERSGFRADSFLEDALANEIIPTGWQIPHTVIREWMKANPPQDLADAIRGLFVLYAQQHGKNRYGDKTPQHVLHLPTIASLFPESRIVHIIRDGRNVALSFLDATFGPRSVEEVAVSWKRLVGAGRRAGAALGPSRYREIRYEDFLDEPEDSVRSLCAFLDLEFEDKMLQYHTRADAIISSAPHPEAHQRLRQPPTRTFRDWRREMSQEDVVLFEALAGDLLVDLGYERGAPSPPFRVQLYARSRRLRIEGERIARQGVRRVRKGIAHQAARAHFAR